MGETAILSEYFTKNEAVVFKNPIGLTVYRYVPSATELDVARDGLAVFNGNESPYHSLESDDSNLAYFKAPEGHLPIYISELTEEELKSQIEKRKGFFATFHDTSKFIVTTITWEALTSGSLELFANNAAVSNSDRGVDITRLIPKQTKEGYVLRRVRDRSSPFHLKGESLSTSLRHRFAKRDLSRTNGEFLLATPSREIFDISKNIQKATLVPLVPPLP